ncbi:MAG: DUF4124 domain-containing protein [Pseudomonadota bacterium]
MQVLRLLAFTLLCGAAGAAFAQWQWVDKDGHKVFSDRPPPVDVPERNILRQPGGRPLPAPATGASAPVVVTAPAGAPGAPGAAAAGARTAAGPALPKPSGKDAELDARKKEAEAAEAAKQKAEEARQAAALADSCQRARQSQATLDSGIRIAQVNAQGERIIMDDSARAAEAQRIQATIQSDCR